MTDRLKLLEISDAPFHNSGDRASAAGIAHPPNVSALLALAPGC